MTNFKENKKKNKYNIKKQLFVTALALVLLLSSTYAWLNISVESKKENSIRAGNLLLTFHEPEKDSEDEDALDNGIVIEKAIPVSDATGMNGKKYRFSLQNKVESKATTKYTILLKNDGNLEENKKMAATTLKYSLTKTGETPVAKELKDDMILETGEITAGQTYEYVLRLWINQDAVNEEVTDKIFKAKLNIVAEQVNSPNPKNENILKVYKYDSDKTSSTNCVSGTEDTCKDITSTKSNTSTYEIGTIVKYKVSDTDTTGELFNVVSDNGTELTLQHTINTVKTSPWYSSANDTTHGPTTIIEALETATTDWNNVKTQSYLMGDEGTASACENTNPITCESSSYNWALKQSNVRIITIQELGSLGCKMSTANSCPVWVYNNLVNSTTYGGTVDNSEYTGYWTMNASSTITTDAYSIIAQHNLYPNHTSENSRGARAVVVINK